MLKLLPSNTKFSRYGKTPKDPPKRAETKGQRALTQKRPKTQKRKRKIRNFYKVIYLKKNKSNGRKRPYLKCAKKRESKPQRFTATMAAWKHETAMVAKRKVKSEEERGERKFKKLGTENRKQRENRESHGVEH